MTLSKPDVSARLTDGHIRFVDPQGNCDDHKDYKIFGDANSIIYFVRVSYNYETEKWYETNSDGTIILTREVPNKGLDIKKVTHLVVRDIIYIISRDPLTRTGWC